MSEQTTPTDDRPEAPWHVKWMWRLAWFGSVACVVVFVSWVALATYTGLPYWASHDDFGNKERYWETDGRGYGNVVGLYVAVNIVLIVGTVLAWWAWWEWSRSFKRKAAKNAERVAEEAARAVLSDEEYSRYRQRTRDIKRERERRGDSYDYRL